MLNGLPVACVVTVLQEFRQHGGANNLAEFVKGAHGASDKDVVAPSVVRAVPVQYTPAARAAGIEGVVEVYVVVTPKGTVDRARVKKSLDKVHGLDDEAVDIAKRYLFKPDSGTFKGVPAPVVVTLTFDFKLR
jgi:TonB family protein